MTHEEASMELREVGAMFKRGMVTHAEWFAEVDLIITELEESVAALERERAEAPVAT